MTSLFPSLISAHLLNLREEIQLLEPYVAGFHIDIMDFHFVDNLTWGPAFINEIRTATSKQLFVHLMVDFPEKYLDRMHLTHNDIVSVHWESPSDIGIQKVLEAIKLRNWIPSLALNPETSIKVLENIQIPEHILLMSVNPGFSGQPFIREMLDKLKELTALRKQLSAPFTIALDGGITAENAKELVAAGADQLAVASAIFSDPDRVHAVHTLLKSIES